MTSIVEKTGRSNTAAGWSRIAILCLTGIALPLMAWAATAIVDHGSRLAVNESKIARAIADNAEAQRDAATMRSQAGADRISRARLEEKITAVQEDMRDMQASLRRIVHELTGDGATK